MKRSKSNARVKVPDNHSVAVIPPLDANQRAVIARLGTSREKWQVAVDAYDPLCSHETIEVRYQAGRTLRKRVPRESHVLWSPPVNRPSGADFVIAGNAGRQESLVPLRVGRMAASPFSFLRGAASAMAWDLSHTPMSGIQTVIDGDAHINNFGLYGTSQRDVVLDLNDFDEAVIGPWEWDLKRLVASVNVAARENGFTRGERRFAVMECVSGYIFNLQRFGPMGILDLWSIYAYADRKPKAIKVPRKSWALIQKTVEKARASHNKTLLAKVARRQANGRWRFLEDPPILTSVDNSTKKKIIKALAQYPSTLPPGYRNMMQRYSIADVAHRVVGVGSVGTRAYLALLFGNGDDDPLFLQLKEATVPAHAPYLPPLPWKVPHHGLRVIAGQRMLQTSGDPLLGHTRIDDRDYFVRQMKNMKASMPLEWLVGEPFYFWGFVCGGLLARAHSRMGDAAKIAGYCGKSKVLNEALAEFAESYGNQTEQDHASLTRAIREGRVRAMTG